MSQHGGGGVGGAALGFRRAPQPDAAEQSWRVCEQHISGSASQMHRGIKEDSDDSIPTRSRRLRRQEEFLLRQKQTPPRFWKASSHLADL